MENLRNKRVADLVTENIKTAHVFKKFGIDFCCGGGVSIQKACEKNEVDFDELVKELIQVDKVKSRRVDYDKWDLRFLIDHIIHIHHGYLEESLPLLNQYAEKVAKVHGHHYTELIEIKDIVNSLAEELKEHMNKEETIVFPAIKQLVDDMKNGKDLSGHAIEALFAPIKRMEEEHDNAGDALKRLTKLTNNFQPPEGACNTFRALYAKLEEFQDDMFQHIHLENNILFPKSKELRSEYLQT